MMEEDESSSILFMREEGHGADDPGHGDDVHQAGGGKVEGLAPSNAGRRGHVDVYVLLSASWDNGKILQSRG